MPHQIFFVYKSIKILHQNISGLINKSDILIVSLSELYEIEKNIDVLCITEHNMKTGDDEFLSIPNFKLASQFTREKRKGGSCILVRQGLKYETIKKVETLSVPNIVEISGVELVDHNLIIICVYRVPKNMKLTLDIFYEKMSQILEIRRLRNKKFILCGDFNINVLQKTSMSNDLEYFLRGYNLKLGVNKPTRLCSGTCLDNFVHNNIDRVKVEVIETALSDHTAQVIECPVKKTCSFKHWFTYIRDYSSENSLKFKECLESLSFSDVYECPDADRAFHMFHEMFTLLYNLCFPIIKIKIPFHKRPKWVSKGIKICSKRKRHLLWKYRLSKSNHDRIVFKQFNKKYKKIIGLTQKSINNNTINMANNKSKATWSIINEKKNNVPKDYIIKININNDTIHNPNEIANAFNDFYINQVQPVRSLTMVSSNNTSQSSMFMQPVTPHDIHMVINDLKNKKSTGYDDVNTSSIKNVSKAICDVLSHITNLCIEQGVFPNDLKISIIKPLFKKGKRDEMSCYRPVALIPIFSKIIEKVIYASLYAFLESKQLLSNCQLGFRKKKSINLAIFKFLNGIIGNLDKKYHVSALFMDLTKAFDYVSHDILLKKLNNLGARGNVLNLIESYLTQRRQITEIERLCPKTKCITKYRSHCKIVRYGVPQGSVLGPLLFIIYINDLPNVTNNDMVLFADDCTIIFNDRNLVNLRLNITDTLTRISEWLKINNLKMNLQKTNIINFRNIHNTTKHKLDIIHNEVKIQETSETKFLGLTIDENIVWKSHVDNICKKLSSYAYALSKLTNIVNENTVIVAYHAYVTSTLRYGIIFWGMSTNNLLVFRAQKRCIRSMFRLTQSDSCVPYFKKLKILPLPCLFIYELSIFVFQNKDLFSERISTRQKGRLQTPSNRTILMNKSVCVMSVIIFNKIPKNIRDIDELTLFKKELLTFLNEKVYYDVKDFLNDRSIS